MLFITLAKESTSRAVRHRWCTCSSVRKNSPPSCELSGLVFSVSQSWSQAGRSSVEPERSAGTSGEMPCQVDNARYSDISPGDVMHASTPIIGYTEFEEHLLAGSSVTIDDKAFPASSCVDMPYQRTGTCVTPSSASSVSPSRIWTEWTRRNHEGRLC